VRGAFLQIHRKQRNYISFLFTYNSLLPVFKTKYDLCYICFKCSFNLMVLLILFDLTKLPNVFAICIISIREILVFVLEI